MQTLKQLFSLPENAQAFGPERLQKVEQALAEDTCSDLPWYLRFIVGLGAWLASLFFIGFFLVLFGLEEKHRSDVGILGVALLFCSTILVQPKLGLFVDQCCLAANLAGQFMIYYGFLPLQHHTLGSAVVLSIVLAATLYWFYQDTVQRLVTSVAALQITLAWIYLGNNGQDFITGHQPRHDIVLWTSLYWAFHLAAIACCWMVIRRWSVTVAPLGYAVIISLVAWQMENLDGVWFRNEVFSPDASNYAPILWPYHMRQLSTAVMLVGVVVWAAGGLGTLSRFWLPYAGLICVLAALIWLGVGGVLLPLLLITLGFFIENGVILGLGLILLPIFLFSYYYNLNLDLLAKSVALIGAGLALLLLRAGLRQGLQLKLKEAL